MIKCCKDCEERQVGCHGWCPRYLNEKDAYDKKKAKEKEAREKQRLPAVTLKNRRKKAVMDWQKNHMLR